MQGGKGPGRYLAVLCMVSAPSPPSSASLLCSSDVANQHSCSECLEWADSASRVLRAEVHSMLPGAPMGLFGEP
jgi:hypothetical protein